MTEQARHIAEMIGGLSPKQQDAVRSYVERLLTLNGEGRNGDPGFAWVGALADLGERYGSVEIQHQIARWRVEAE